MNGNRGYTDKRTISTSVQLAAVFGAALVLARTILDAAGGAALRAALALGRTRLEA